MSLDVYLLCKHCGQSVFSQNITHNLGNMASAAGLYQALWCPNEIGITKAAQLIPILENGINRLNKNPVEFKKYEPKNGWGTYADFVPWVAAYLEACIENPDMTVNVSR